VDDFGDAERDDDDEDDKLVPLWFCFLSGSFPAHDILAHIMLSELCALG
jgi:hypothetical protein